MDEKEDEKSAGEGKELRQILITILTSLLAGIIINYSSSSSNKEESAKDMKSSSSSVNLSEADAQADAEKVVEEPVIQKKDSRLPRKSIKIRRNNFIREPRLKEPEQNNMMSMKTTILSLSKFKQKQPLRQLYGIFHVHGKDKHYDTRSYFVFNQDMWLRKTIVWLVEWRWFHNFILLTIIFNSVALAMENYEERVNPQYKETSLDRFSKTGNIISTWIFIVEFVLKSIAMGLVLHKKSYLRQWWNILDFLTVIIGIFEIAQFNSGSFTLLRMLRLLKPLRSIKAFTTLRFLISSLLASLAGLINVFMFLGFVFSVFATLGVNIFPGKAYQFCRVSDQVIYPEDGSDPYWPKLDDFDHLCHSDEFCKSVSGVETSVCGSTWEKAGLNPLRYDGVRDNERILFGIPGFDNFGQALYTVFQICTLESWSYLMYNYEESSESALSTYFFFPSIVIFGSFFTMNLILANILDAFNSEQEQKEAKEREYEERKRIQLEAESAIQTAKELSQAIIKQSINLGNLSLGNLSLIKNPSIMSQTVAPTIETQAKVHTNSRMIRLNSLDDHGLQAPNTKANKKRRATISILSPNRRTSMLGGVINEDPFGLVEEIKEVDSSDISKSSSSIRNEISSSFGSSRRQSQLPDLILPAIQVLPNPEGIIFQDHDIDAIEKYGGQPMAEADQAEASINQSIERTQYIDNTVDVIEMTNLDASREEIVRNQIFETPKSSRQVKSSPKAHQPESQQEEPQSKNDSDQESSQNPEGQPKIDEFYLSNLHKAPRTNNKVVVFFHGIITSVPFNVTMILLILANTVTMATYTCNQPKKEKELIRHLDILFDVTFLLEMVFKLIGFGPRAYINDKWNIFDAFIVLVSISDQILLHAGIASNDDGISTFFQLLRLLRLLRMLKLARYFRGMRSMLQKTAMSLCDIGPFAFLLFLFIYLFALIGRELFAFKALVDEDEEFIYGEELLIDYHQSDKLVRYPRINFNSFWNSMTAVFILINGEDWIWIAQDWIRAYGASNREHESYATIFFVILMLIGHLTLFALFTGILLYSFQENSHKDASQRRSDSEKPFGKLIKEGFQQLCIGLGQKIKDKKSKPEEDSGEEEKSDGLQHQPSIDPQIKEIMQKKATGRVSLNRRPTFMELNMSTDLAHYDFNSLRTKDKKDGLKQILALNVELEGKALGLFSPTHKFRVVCSTITQHWFFQLVILLLIVTTSLFLATESPLNDPKGQEKRTYQIIDFTITALFVIEAILKVITLGFVMNGKNSYLQSPWNILDFIVVIVSVAEIAAAQTESLSTIKTLRIMRLLRPIRLVAQNGTLKSAITTLLKSVPKILELLSLVVLFVFMFAVLETYLFSGKFNYCYTEHLNLHIRQEKQLIKTKWDCLNYGGEWHKPQLNFDSIGNSMLSLSSIQSHEGWLGMMWSSADATEVDMMPEEDINKYIFVPFTLFVIFAICLLFLNLFVGVVIETFNTQKEILTNNHLLTTAQRTHLMTQLNTFIVSPQPRLVADEDSTWVRRICIIIIKNSKFEPFIIFVILLNTVVLASNHYMIDEGFRQVLETSNGVFSIIFGIEAIMKIVALKKAYFADNWNRFDFTIIFFSALLIIPVSLGYLTEFQGLTTTIRVLRVARMLRLVVRAKKLRIIFQTLFDSAPTLASLGFLLLLSIYMFAIIGVQLFALQDLRETPGLDQEMGYFANFQSFDTAFMTLLRCATGENWNQIMFECARTHSLLYQCVEGETYDSIVAAGRDPSNWDGPRGCGSLGASVIFHITFQLMITQIFLNLFIAIIVDAFMGVSEKFQLPVTQEALIEFSDFWSKFDPKATGFIKIEKLDELLVDIANSHYASELLILVEYVQKSAPYREMLIQQLDIPTFGRFKKVMFYDTLQKLTMRVVKLSSIKKNLSENVKKIKVLERISGKGEKFVIKNIEICNMNTDYQKHFDEMLKRLDKIDCKIELITQLRFHTQRLTRMYSHLVDNSTIFDSVPIKLGAINTSRYVMIYTTRHYVAATHISRWYRGVLESRLIRSDLSQGSVSSPCSSELDDVQVIQQSLDSSQQESVVVEVQRPSAADIPPES